MKKIISFLICILMLFMLSLSAFAEEEIIEISKGAEYSLVTKASEAYPDDGKKLTDGVYGTHPEGYDGFYASGAYVGFNKDNINENGQFAIILDLGKKYSGISQLTAGYLCETIVGISAPKEISFAISDERNGEYSQVGKLETTPENLDASATYAKSLDAKNASGRYVLVTITPMSYTDKDGVVDIAPWTFIDEIAVFAAASPSNDEESDDSQSESQIPTGDETLPDESIPDKTPQTGDSLEIFAFVILAMASVTMLIALFANKRREKF